MTSEAAKKAWVSRRRGHHAKSSKHSPRHLARHSKTGEFWIQGAVTRPGALRAKVQKAFGKKGFDNRGRIKVSILQALAKGTDLKTRHQAQFALNVRR